VLLGRIARIECKDARALRCGAIPMFRGLSVHARLLNINTSCAKTDEPIEIAFGGADSGGPKKPGGGPDPSPGKWAFGGRPCDVAFRQNSLTICCSYASHFLLESVSIGLVSVCLSRRNKSASQQRRVA